MTLEQYNRILQSINTQIKDLQQSRDALIEQHQDHIKKQIKKRQENDRKWFVSNFNVFWDNRHRFAKNTPNGDIVIDFFGLYVIGNRAGCKYVQHITISDLIALWDFGFKYQGNPIVELTNTVFANRLTYIKNEKLVTVSGIKDEALAFSPVLSAILEYLCKHKTIESEFAEYKTLQVMKDLLTN